MSGKETGVRNLNDGESLKNPSRAELGIICADVFVGVVHRVEELGLRNIERPIQSGPHQVGIVMTIGGPGGFGQRIGQVGADDKSIALFAS